MWQGGKHTGKQRAWSRSGCEPSSPPQLFTLACATRQFIAKFQVLGLCDKAVLCESSLHKQVCATLSPPRCHFSSEPSFLTNTSFLSLLLEGWAVATWGCWLRPYFPCSIGVRYILILGTSSPATRIFFFFFLISTMKKCFNYNHVGQIPLRTKVVKIHFFFSL